MKISKSAVQYPFVKIKNTFCYLTAKIKLLANKIFNFFKRSHTNTNLNKVVKPNNNSDSTPSANKSAHIAANNKIIVNQCTSQQQSENHTSNSENISHDANNQHETQEHSANNSNDSNSVELIATPNTSQQESENHTSNSENISHDANNQHEAKEPSAINSKEFNSIDNVINQSTHKQNEENKEIVHEGITFKGTQLETKNKIELYNHFKSRIKPDTIEKITSQDATVFFTQLFQLRSPRILKQSLETITQILSNPPDNFKFDKGLKLNQSRVPMTAIYLLIYGICGNDTETGGILCKSIEDKKKPLKDSRVNCSLIELLCLCYENTTSNKKNLEEILNDCLNDKKTFATKISNHIFNFKFNYFKSSNSSSLETVSLEVKKQVMKFLGIEFTEQAPTCGNFQKFDFKTMIYLIKKIEYSSEVLPEHLIENWKNIAIKLCKAEYRGVYHNKRYNMLLATKVKQEYEAGVLESLKKTWFSNLNFIVDDTTVYESTCPWKMLNATTIINGCLSIQYPDRKRYKGIMDFFTPTAKLIYVTDSSGNWLARAFIQADFDNKTITVHLMKSKPGHKQPYEQIKKALELIIRKKAASLGSDWKIIDHTGN